jgi:hypothetical protein
MASVLTLYHRYRALGKNLAFAVDTSQSIDNLEIEGAMRPAPRIAGRSSADGFYLQ